MFDKWALAIKNKALVLAMNESNLIMFFGNSPVFRILDVLIENAGLDYSKKQIQELAGISKACLFQHWRKIEELGLVKVTRTFGKTRLFTLNTESRIAKNLMKLELDLIEETSPKTIQKQKMQKIAVAAR